MMKRFFYFLMAALLPAGPMAASVPVKAPQFQGLYDAFTEGTGDLLFFYDTDLMEASVADLFDEYEEYYEMDVIDVPVSISVKMGGASMSGDEISGYLTCIVTALGERAFFKASAAEKVRFAEGSMVRTFAPYAMHTMPNMKGVLTLPENLETIEHDGIGNMAVEKVVFPASLNTLGESAVVLSQADTLVFLGTVPPLCATAEGKTGLSWKSAEGETRRDVVVIVPAGCAAAYRAKAGIGDWFTNIREPGQAPTGMVQTEQDGLRVMRGVWSLTGMYMGSGTENLPCGIYIIDGQKTVK